MCAQIIHRSGLSVASAGQPKPSAVLSVSNVESVNHAQNVRRRGPTALFVAFVIAACTGVCLVGPMEFPAMAETGIVATAGIPNRLTPAPAPVTGPGDTAMKAPPAQQSKLAPMPEPTGENSVASLVTNADRLNIKFQGHPTLSGDYRIAGDETLTLPVIGRISVTGLTLSQLEKRLNAEVLQNTGREAFAMVEVVDYREIFVTGFVSRAGSFPWKRGMKVLQAETLSGGIYRPAAQTGTPIPADGELMRARRAAVGYVHMLARKARVEAEATGKTKLVASDRLNELSREVDVEQTLAAEQAVLKSHVKTYEAQVAALKQLKKSSTEQMDVLRKQKDRIEAQIKAYQDQQHKLEGLASRGIVTNDRMLGQQTRVVDLEERSANVTLAYSKVEAAAISADRDLEVLTLKRNADLESEQVAIDQEAAQLEIEMSSASSTFQKMTGQRALRTSKSAKADKNDTLMPQLSYEIVRTIGDETKNIPATRSSPLFPGDVLVVSLQEGM